MRKAILIYLLIFCSGVFAQSPLVNHRYESPLWLVNLSYKAAMPVGDLALRYGFMNGAGLDIYYKTKRNFLFGVNANLLFGKNVRDVDYINYLKDNNGYLFTDNGTPIFVNASMRGGQIQGAFGKLFPVFKNKPELSIRLQLGAGFTQHKYYFSAPGALQFSKEYVKGYDRLSNGFALSQEAGICYMSLAKLINFNLGIEVTEAFTQNRRYYDYATGALDTKKYLDMFVALKLSWVLPVKATDKSEQIFFQ